MCNNASVFTSVSQHKRMPVHVLCCIIYPNKKFLTFLGQGSYYLDQDSKILDQHCKNALDILARLQDAVLNMASFAISSSRDL